MNKKEFKRLSKKIDMTIHIDSRDLKVRSPFANITFTGCGPHKSVKDYNRQREKLNTKKFLKDYE